MITIVNMKQLEKRMETPKAYLERFDICSHSLVCKRYCDIRILHVYAATVTHRRWLWPVKFVLEGTVASEGGIPGL
jgi:hypothetical protein